MFRSLLFPCKLIKNARFIYKEKPIQIREIPFCFSLSQKFNQISDKYREDLVNGMSVYHNFLSEKEETDIVNEVDPYMKGLHYEFDHWDDAIHGYRETEIFNWNKANSLTLKRVTNLAFPPNVKPLKCVHVLDLNEKGFIKPHIDAVRFCGDTIAGLSLLSDCVMRLVHDKNPDLIMNVLLKRRSLYIMTGAARFDYTHEILRNDCSVFNGIIVPKTRRISVICRNEPSPVNAK